MLSIFQLKKNILLIHEHLTLTIIKLELSDFHEYIEEKRNCGEKTNIIQS